MALVLNDRVKETTTTTGTSTVDLAGAETGFESFVAGIGNSNTTYYAIVHQTANEFEIGIGTVTDASPDTLSRTTIISSSNSDAAVNFSSGTKDVFCTLPASKAVVFDDSSGSSDVAIGSRGTNPMGISYTGTVLAVSEQTGTASVQVDGGNAARLDFGVGGTALFRIYTDTSNYSEFKRTTDHPILFAVNNAETARFTSSGMQFAASKNISNASGDLTVDVAGDIILDADGENIIFKDGGTERGQIDLGSANFTLRASTSDKDMIFRVNDGGTEIVALTIDASESGAATFNSTVSFKFLNGSWISSADGVNRLYYATNGTSYYKTGDDHQFRNSSDATKVSFDSSGNGVFAGNVTAYGSPSDIVLKENVSVIDNAMEKVNQLKGITYDLKSDGNRLTGLVAQDLEKVLPEAVYTAEDLEGKEHLAIRYGNTVGLLVEAIKELSAKIEKLEGK
jgi:hypothetical protein